MNTDYKTRFPVTLTLHWAGMVKVESGHTDIRSARAELIRVMGRERLGRQGNGFTGQLIDKTYLPEPTQVATYEITVAGDR